MSELQLRADSNVTGPEVHARSEPPLECKTPSAARPLRILVGADVPPDPNSGAAGTVYHTNAALRELGHEVDEIWRDDLPHRIRHGNLHYLLELPRAYRNAVRKRCENKQYDVIQLSQPYAWLAAKDHQRSGRPGVFVVRSHGIEQRVAKEVKRCCRDRDRRPWFRRLASHFLQRVNDRYQLLASRHANGLLVPCRDDARYLIDHFNVQKSKVGVVWHGVPDNFIKHPLATFSEERHRRLLHVAQFSDFKAPWIVAEVANRLLAERDDISFTWVCATEDHAAVVAMLDPKIRTRVSLLGWQNQDGLREVYDSHGIFVFPSLAEGAGKACLEALCGGMCVVATGNSGMKDYIVDGVSGRLVDAGDTEGFVLCVRDVLSDIEKASAMVIAARAVGAQFSWHRCAQQAAAFYERLGVQKDSTLNPNAVARR